MGPRLPDNGNWLGVGPLKSVLEEATDCDEVEGGKWNFCRLTLAKRLSSNPTGVNEEAIGDSLGVSFEDRPDLNAMGDPTNGSAELAAWTPPTFPLGLALG